MKSHCLGPQLLSDYVFLHYNYKYDWLRWTLEEIVDTYAKLYGKESCELDIESDGRRRYREVPNPGLEPLFWFLALGGGWPLFKNGALV